MRIISVTIRRKNRPGVNYVGIPLFVVWLVILPVAILLSPLILIACMIGEVNPFTVYSILWEILRGVAGTEVEVDDKEHSILVSVSQEEQ